jgi:hypothetical protein
MALDSSNPSIDGDGFFRDNGDIESSFEQNDNDDEIMIDEDFDIGASPGVDSERPTSDEPFDDIENSFDHSDNEGIAEEDCAQEPAAESTRHDVATTTRTQILMTIVHFMITYPRFSLSLFLLLASRSVAVPSFQEGVLRPIHDLNVLVDRESKYYRQCVQSHFDFASSQGMTAASNRETERLQRIREDKNAAILEQAKAQASACNKTFSSMERLMRIWMDENIDAFLASSTLSGVSLDGFVVNPSVDYQLHLVSNKSTCSPDDLQTLSRLIFPESNVTFTEESARSGSISSLWAEYRGEAESSLRHMSAYVANRTEYDYNYFIGIKINSALDILANVMLPNVSLSIDKFAMIEGLQVDLLDLRSAWQDVSVRIKLLEVRIKDFFASLQALELNYSDLFSRLLRASNFIRDFLPGGVPLPDFLDISSVPSVELLLPTVFSVPSFPGDIADIDVLLTDLIQRVLKRVLSVLQELSKEVGEQVEDIILALVDALRDLLTLEDYFPPQFVGLSDSSASADDEVAHLANKGEQYQQATVEAFESQRSAAGVFDTANSSTWETKAVSLNSTFADDPRVFSYQDPLFPRIAIPGLVIALISWIFANQWMIEMVVQFVRLIRLKEAHERRAAPHMPELAYSQGKDGGDQGGYSSSLAVEVQRAVLQHFITPWMAMSLVLLPFAFVGVFVWFPHVKRSCIDSRHGTFAARNIITPWMINRASLAGNQQFTVGQLQCRDEQRRTCIVESETAESNFLSDQFDLSTILGHFNETVIGAELVRRCISPDMVDATIDEACCGLEGYGVTCKNNSQYVCPVDTESSPLPSAFRPLGEYLDDENCLWRLSSDWVLSDSRFDCSALNNVCLPAACESVDADFIRHFTIEADCQVEVFAMKCCFLILFALFHAVTVNLICTLAYSGVQHIWWRSLQPSGFKFLSRVNKEGELILGNDSVERRIHIETATLRFERIGYYQLVASSLLFLSWICASYILGFLVPAG